MMECSCIYFREGLVEAEARFVKQKSLLAEFQGWEDFVEFIQEWEKEDLFDNEIKNSVFEEKWKRYSRLDLPSAWLMRLLNRYCAIMGYTITNQNSGGERCFKITKG